jgi:hypothetical protein
VAPAPHPQRVRPARRGTRDQNVVQRGLRAPAPGRHRGGPRRAGPRRSRGRAVTALKPDQPICYQEPSGPSRNAIRHDELHIKLHTVTEIEFGRFGAVHAFTVLPLAQIRIDHHSNSFVLTACVKTKDGAAASSSPHHHAEQHASRRTPNA